MPAVSKSQQALFAVAEHNPSKLHKKNLGLLKLTHDQLHDFAATTTKDLPKKVSKSKGVKR